VAPLAQSLNTSDVFLLNNARASFLWVGKKSIGDEQHFAREVEKRISDSAEFKLVHEGKESEVFWQLLGGKAEYASEKNSVVS